MASRRTILAGSAFVLSVLSTVFACQRFGDAGIGALVIPTGSSAPNIGSTPIATLAESTAPPTSFGATESPMPITASQSVAPSGAPTETAFSSPTPISEPLIALEESAASEASLTNVAPEAPAFLKSAAVFTLARSSIAPLSGSITLAVQSATDDLAVYRSNANRLEDHLFWNRLSATVSVNANHARVSISDVRDGRHLLAGGETTTLPSDIEFTTFPIIDSGAETSLDYNEATGMATSASYKAQYIAGGPNETQVFSLPATATVESDKTQLIFICGAGSEQYKEELYRWKPFIDWVKQSVWSTEFAKRFSVLFSHPDSRLSFSSGESSAQGYVPRYQIPVGHSMGGLRARTKYAKLFGQNLCPGAITIGSANRGTPLGCPKWKRLAFSSQPTPTLLSVLDAAAMNNVFGAFRQISLKRKVSDAVADLTKTSTDGNLSMAANETEFGIPAVSFTTRFSFGRFAGIPISEKIGEEDKRVLRLAASGFANDPAGAAVAKRRENGVDYINELEALEQYEKNVGCATVPHLITYAGYVSGGSAVTAAHDFFERAKTVEGLTAIIRDSSKSAINATLQWLALSINAIIPSASGRKSMLSDGLVRTEDAHLLAGGEPVASANTDGSFQHSDSVIANRKSPMVRTMRTFPGRTHLDLLTDPAVFAALAADIIALDDEIHAAKTTTLSVADKKSIDDRIKEDFSGNTKIGWTDTSPEGYLTYYDRYDRTDPPYGNITYSAKGPNKAAVSFCTYTRVYTVVTGWLSLYGGGANYEGWQCYTIPTMQKVGKAWLYAKGTRYALKGGFLSYDPGAPAAP